MLPPATLACAFSAKRPKPPAGEAQSADQRSMSRSEVESAATMPSMRSVGR